MQSNRQNFQKFESNLEKFAKLIGQAPATVTRRLALDAHRRVSLRTPVDTGRARASWDLKQGSPSDYVPSERKGSAKDSGTAALGTGMAGNQLSSSASAGGEMRDVSTEAGQIDGKQEVFITTALEYVQHLENGSSAQAPAGMVRLSIAEMEVEIESIVEQLDNPEL